MYSNPRLNCQTNNFLAGKSITNFIFARNFLLFFKIPPYFLEPLFYVAKFLWGNRWESKLHVTFSFLRNLYSFNIFAEFLDRALGNDFSHFYRIFPLFFQDIFLNFSGIFTPRIPFLPMKLISLQLQVKQAFWTKRPGSFNWLELSTFVIGW